MKVTTQWDALARALGILRPPEALSSRQTVKIRLLQQRLVVSRRAIFVDNEKRNVT